MNPVNPHIGAYLDRLTKPLERTLGREELNEYKMGALFHIESLVAREIARGFAEEEAVTNALAEFGPADSTGLGMLDEWCRGREALTFTRSSSAAVWWSFAHFGLAFGVALLAIEFTQVSPRLLGFETDALSKTIVAVAPLVAGIATGIRVPTGNLRALLVSLSPLLPYSQLVALVSTSVVEPGQIAWLLIAWPLLGSLSLSVTAWLRRHGRRPAAPRKVTS